MDAASTRDALLQAYNVLSRVEEWEHTVIEAPMRELAIELNLKPGQLFGSIRVAISGRTATPPLFQMMEVLGHERTLRRIDQAIARLA
jgi:glutamyl-tRNA synthetase